MSGLSFVKYGSGPISVVLIHGFCEDRRIFEDIIPHLDQKQFTWFVPDLPGFGDSSKLGLLENSLTGYADYIRDWMLDQSKNQIILAGHSMGGYIALDFASHYPDALKGLILIHSQAGADNMEKRRSRDEHIAFIEQNGMAKFAQKLIPQLYMKEWREANPTVINTWIDRISKYNAKSVIKALQCMRDRRDYTGILRKLRVPVGIIAGDKDPVINRETSLTESRLNGNTCFHLIESAGHMSMLESPEALTEALNNCINEFIQVTV